MLVSFLNDQKVIGRVYRTFHLSITEVNMSVVSPGARLTCIVELPSGERVEFVIAAHASPSTSERLIELPFYGANPPQGEHHELEVLSPNLREHEHRKKVHMHQSLLNQRDFVCWTGHLPTLDEVRAVLPVWCVGTAYSMHTGRTFDSEYVKGSDTFVERMAKQRIEFVSLS